LELTLQIPAEWRTFNEFFGFEAKPGFRLFGPDGAEIQYQRVAQNPNRTKYRASSPLKFPVPHKTNDVTVVVRLTLPPLGYSTLTVREGEMAANDEIVGAAMLPTRHPELPGLATSERSMANERLAVTIEANGTLTLTDKRTGETYERLLTFEDTADIGDGWYHGQAVNDQACYSSGRPADVALVHNGPLSARFRIRSLMRVPAEFHFDRMVRSTELNDLVIDSLVTLRQGSDRLEVRTTVQNTVRDHRLRLLLPTGAKAGTYLSDGAFDVVERPIALPADAHLNREIPVETGAQQTWSAVAGDHRGLAVVSSGLLECFVRDQPERPIVLTLFRGTRRTIMTDGQPDGQLLGELPRIIGSCRSPELPTGSSCSITGSSSALDCAPCSCPLTTLRSFRARRTFQRPPRSCAWRAVSSSPAPAKSTARLRSGCSTRRRGPPPPASISAAARRARPHRGPRSA
jgi:alpha-mannosidase/mannosylglycerate hydrolase